jgi:hypothetical protein
METDRTWSSAEGHTGTTNREDAITWETRISLLRNPLVLRQTALVALGSGLLMALLMTVMAVARGEFGALPTLLLMSFGVALGLGLLMLGVMLVVFGGGYYVQFSVDEHGALWQTTDTRSRGASRWAILAGTLGGSPQVAGAGALALSRESIRVRWQDVSAVRTNSRHRMIVLRDRWHPVMMLVCLPENYARVARYVERQLDNPAPRGSKHSESGDALDRVGFQEED